MTRAIETARPAVEPLALYVHWPFCLAKCPYCDFNSHVRERIDEAGWRGALLRALERQAEPLGRVPVTSIFFGGGTPSLMDPASVAAVIDRAAERFDLAPDAEITLEANPTSVEAGRFAGFRTAGVNRVSIGVQSFDEAALRFLGRRHDADQARRAVALAARTFPRYSFDLIYARPGQDVASWRGELEDALALARGHVSLYHLTIEAGTAFEAAHRRGDFALPDDDLAGALFETTAERLEAAGYRSYEISNHAWPGHESRHNLAYWRYGSYLGVGPGAHGRLRVDAAVLATRQIKAPELWIADIDAGGAGMAECTQVDREERLIEMLMMGLRLAEPIQRARFQRETGMAPEMLFDLRRLDPLIEDDLLRIDAEGIATTPRGRQRLNAVLDWLIAARVAAR